MTNPIRKQAHLYTAFGMSAIRARWVAVCPDCGEKIDGDRYHRATRKTAKDALHRHRLKEHAGPGWGVS